MFLNLIDSLTPWHLRILNFFQNPRIWFEENNMQVPQFSMGSSSQVLETAFNELKGKGSFYGLIVKDLYSQGLLSSDSLNTLMT